MNQQVQSPQELLQALEGLLETQTLAPQPARHGLRLLEKALVPVTIAIVGLPGSGKSQIINLLAGRKLFSDSAPCPSLELSWGEAERTTLEFEDGTSESCDGIVTQLNSGREPVTAKISAPLPGLKRVTLLELPSPGTTEELRDALKLAVRRADIILWCSQGFSDTERALWAGVPDNKKDHSFFLLTKADQLAAQGHLADRIAALQNVVADEFHSLIPVATLQAVEALAPSGVGNIQALTASGGKALITTIAREVDNGRRAYFDGILLFLRRYGAIEIKPTRQSQARDRQTEPRAAKNTDKGESVINASLARLQECGKELIRLRNATDDVNARILEHCVTVSNEIADMFTSLDNVSVSFTQLHETAMETADIVLLMQLEGGTGPAADAVSILLQLRRGLEAQAAA